jgi:mRNA-degrading endonuclease HigB of HigAB toxin-antitoxin module
MKEKQIVRNMKPSHARQLHKVMTQLRSGHTTAWDLGKRLNFSKHSKSPIFSIPIAGNMYRLVVRISNGMIEFLGCFTHQKYEKFIHQL